LRGSFFFGVLRFASLFEVAAGARNISTARRQLAINAPCWL
jgi:hypothetical protein